MTGFVGRGPYLEQLAMALGDAVHNRGRLVLVAGEPGIGKSTLVAQFLAEASVAVPNARIVSTYCSEQYGADEPYQPFVEAFRELLRDPDGAGPKRGFGDYARELAPFWLQAIPMAGGLIAAATVTAVELKSKRRNLRDMAGYLAPYWLQAVPVAGELLAVASETAVQIKQTLGPSSTTASAPPSEEALFYQYTELFSAAAGDAPLILVIDDLHWADRASVKLLEHLANKIKDQRALIIGTYRPGDVAATSHPLLQARANLLEADELIELLVQPFQADELAALATEQLGEEVSRNVVQWMQKHVGGNALFFRELLAWLVEQNYVQLRHGEWNFHRRPADLDVPRSAESVIEKRLLKLDPDLYKMIEYASVEGDQFHSAVVARLLGIDSAELEQTFDAMAGTSGIIRVLDTRTMPNGESSRLYGFSHTLVQDVLHNNLFARRRMLMHRRMGEILESIYGTDSTTIAHRLAIHYDEGHHTERAFEFATRAAQHAARVFALWDAVDLLQRALRNAPLPHNRLIALEQLGGVHARLARYGDALTAFDEALQLAAVTKSAERAVAIRREVVRVQSNHGAQGPVELLAELARLERDARALNADQELCQILWLYRRLPGSAGSEHVNRARAALELVQSTASPELLATGAFELGYALLFNQDPQAAIPHLQHAIGLYNAIGDEGRVGVCHNCMAVAYVLAGEPETAIEQFDNAARTFEKVGDPMNVASVRNNLGSLLTQMGEWQRAETNLREAVRLAERIGANARLMHPLENYAQLFAARGELVEAERLWRRLATVSEETGYWNSQIIALSGLGDVFMQRGELTEATRYAEAARSLVKFDAPWSESRAAWQLLAARVEHAHGNHAQANTLLREGETAMAGRDQYRATVFQLTRAELGLAAPDERAVLQNCVESFVKLGALPMAQRARRLLENLEAF